MTNYCEMMSFGNVCWTNDISHYFSRLYSRVQVLECKVKCVLLRSKHNKRQLSRWFSSSLRYWDSRMSKISLCVARLVSGCPWRWCGRSSTRTAKTIGSCLLTNCHRALLLSQCMGLGCEIEKSKKVCVCVWVSGLFKWKKKTIGNKWRICLDIKTSGGGLARFNYSPSFDKLQCRRLCSRYWSALSRDCQVLCLPAWWILWKLCLYQTRRIH